VITAVRDGRIVVAETGEVLFDRGAWAACSFCRGELAASFVRQGLCPRCAERHRRQQLAAT
jgi:hypothetical protein